MSKEDLINGSVWHLFNKSIAGFEIFSSENEFERMTTLLRYYQFYNNLGKFSRSNDIQESLDSWLKSQNENLQPKLVDIVAYCIMPMHIHLVLRQLGDNGISTFIHKVMDSYSKYFNIKHNRKGPLWESRFKKVLVGSDAQLLHLTGYVHLNPVTAYLVERPEEWKFSSYHEYLKDGDMKLSNWEGLLDVKSSEYKKFVESNIFYERARAKSKKIFL